MKINNPQRFFPQLSNDPNYSEKKRLSTLMTRGDVIRKFCSFDSSIESDWHISETPDDLWIKFSYDGGFTYPLKFKYKNNLLVKQEVLTSTSVVDGLVEFNLTNYSDPLYGAVKNGHISIFSRNNEGWMRNLYDFSYLFDDSRRVLMVKLLTDVPEDSINIVSMIEVDGTSAMALAIASPVYSSSITAIPSVYDEEFGICNLLDEGIPMITCTTKFEDVNRLSLKMRSADPNVSDKQVKLAFNCGSTSWQEVFDEITATEKWVSITPPERLTGTLTITRLLEDSADTLKADDLVISLCITNIKAEII
jgi:hypothetical protein